MSRSSFFYRVGAFTLLLLALSSLFAAAPAAAGATVIRVTSTDHEIAPFVNDGDCSLGEALAAAAADAPVDGCTSRHFGTGGPFFITLAPNATYSLTAVDNTLAGANGLPIINRDVTIQGYYATIERNTSAPSFRLLYVGSTGRLTLDSLRLQNGAATSDGTRCQDTGWACGGAILNEGGQVTIKNSFVTNNVAEAGGGLMTVDGIAIIQNSTFIENFAVGAQGQGGAIAQFGSLAILIENSTIANNGAEKRGGGLQNEGLATITHTTFFGNGAELGGNLRNYQGEVEISNSIMAEAADGGNCATLEGITTSQGYNVEDANDCEFGAGSDQSNVPAGLAALDSGQFVPHFPLLSSSVAIDNIPTGSNDCQAGSSADQRFFVRANGVGQGGSGCDSGAYEFDTNSPVTTISLAEIQTDVAAGQPLGAFTSAIFLALFTLFWLHRSGWWQLQTIARK